MRSALRKAMLKVVVTTLMLALAAAGTTLSSAARPAAEDGFKTASAAPAGLRERSQSETAQRTGAAELHQFAIPGGVGVGVSLDAEAVTLTAEFAVGELPRRADFRIVFGGLAGEDRAPQIALVASPGQNWFNPGWDLRLEVAPGIVLGDPGAYSLRSGLSQPFLFPGESYRAVMAWDQARGELSFSLWNVTRDSEVVAGFLYLEPEAGQRLSYGVVAISEASESGEDAGGGATWAAGLAGTTTHSPGEVERQFRKDPASEEESLPAEGVRTQLVLAGFPVRFAGLPVEIAVFRAEPGYTRLGELLPLSSVRAGIVRSPAARPGGEEEESRGVLGGFGEQFVSSIAWGEDGLGVRIVRTYGTLPGVFKVYVSDGGDAGGGASRELLDTAAGAGQSREQGLPAEELLFTLPAAALDVRATLPPRALPPGVYSIRIVYEEVPDCLKDAVRMNDAACPAAESRAGAGGESVAGTPSRCEAEVRSMTFAVRPPKVEARLVFDWKDWTGPVKAAESAEMRTARRPKPAEMQVHVEITADQQLDWLRLTARSAEETTLFERQLENVPRGAVRVSFNYSIANLSDLFQPVELVVQWPPAQAARQAFRPLALAIGASGEAEEVTSYQQKVRRLVPPQALDLLTLTGVSGEGGAATDQGGGVERGGTSRAESVVSRQDEDQRFRSRTYDLVEVTVLSNLAEAFARDVRVWAAFTSPSGEVFEAPGRRLARPGASAAWVARVLPAEPGEWSYRLHLSHPGAFPEGIELASGAFWVSDSGRRVPSARRPWGETEHKPEGWRVSSVRYRPGTTVKLEQLIGDWDSHLQIPTLNQTLTDYGVIGTDLGQPFEHEGSVVLLFGDTMGTRGFVESSMAQSPTVDPEKGLALEFYTDVSGCVLRIRPPGLSMGGFEVPSGGISLDGKVYFVVKDQRTELPEGMTFRSVLVRFDEDRREFVPVREFSPLHGKFAEVVARRAPEGVRGTPFEGPALLFWGSGEYYRKGSLYLAITRPEDIEQPGRMYYFAGFGESGEPLWVTEEEKAAPVLRHSQIGEFSVVYSEELDIWLLTYNSGSPRGIVFHWAHEPWGPWSPGQVIFEPWRDGGYGRFMHALNMPNPKLAGPVINPSPQAVEQWGGEYAPYMIERFLRYRDGRLVVYYLMSTWNPYVVVLMRSEFDVGLE